MVHISFIRNGNEYLYMSVYDDYPFHSRYDPELARFQDPPPDESHSDSDHTPFCCQSCLRISRKEREKIATPGSRLEEENSDRFKTQYRFLFHKDTHTLSLSPSLSLFLTHSHTHTHTHIRTHTHL